METFFGRLKTEMFYGHEKDFESFEKFSKAINEYIDYYNNKRIQSKTNWMPPAERESLRQYNQGLAYEVPVTFAKLSRVPIVHANHCGIVTAYNFPNADKLQTRQFVGAAQIVDGTGQVLARRNFFEGGGFVIADILLNTTCQKTEKFSRISIGFLIYQFPTYRRGIPSIPRVSTIIIPLHCLIIKKQITFKLLEV